MDGEGWRSNGAFLIDVLRCGVGASSSELSSQEELGAGKPKNEFGKTKGIDGAGSG